MVLMKRRVPKGVSGGTTGHHMKNTLRRMRKRLSKMRRRQKPGRRYLPGTNGSVWVLDTGASEHVTGDVTTGELIEGLPTLEFDTAKGQARTQGFVKHRIPGLRGQHVGVRIEGLPNMVSMGQLTKQGYTLAWGPDGCALWSPRGTEIPLEVVDNVPILRGSDFAGCTLTAETPSSSSSEDPGVVSNSEEPVSFGTLPQDQQHQLMEEFMQELEGDFVEEMLQDWIDSGEWLETGDSVQNV